jgi:hypothetical protein
MPNPFKNAPTKEEVLAKQAAAATAEAEHLTGLEAAKVVDPDLGQELNKVLGVARNTKPQVQTKSSDEVDLDDLDETTLMKYPIVAKSMNEEASQTMKPKDSSIVFHWCYFNNGMFHGDKDKVSAVNVGRYKRWGFDFATINDVEGGEDALTDGIIDDGGKIINYDTVLMKVDKIRLMSHYKKNLLGSLLKVDNALGRAIKEAEGSMLQSGEYGRAMATHPQAKIEFYSPVEK